MKFKIWDKVNKVWLGERGINKDILWDAFGVTVDLDFCEVEFKNPNYEIASFTKEVDSRMKNIYEGDIVVSIEENGIFLCLVKQDDEYELDESVLNGFLFKLIKEISQGQYIDELTEEARNLLTKYNIPVVQDSNDPTEYRDWETDRKSTRLNSSHSAKSRMPSSA